MDHGKHGTLPIEDDDSLVPSHRFAGALGDAYIFRVDSCHSSQGNTKRTEAYASDGSTSVELARAGTSRTLGTLLSKRVLRSATGYESSTGRGAGRLVHPHVGPLYDPLALEVALDQDD